MKHSRKNGIVGMRHRAPETRRHVRVAHRVLVGEVRRPCKGCPEKQRVLIGSTPSLIIGRPHGDDDRLVGLAHLPRGPVAVLVERGAQLDQRHRAITALLHVFLARPLQPHRRARHGLRDLHRLLGVLLVRSAPAEAAAGMHLVHVHVFERNARRFGGGRDRGLAVLRADPDFHACRPCTSAVAVCGSIVAWLR